METKYVYIDRNDPEREKLEYAAGLLKSGELVAFPTETVYGLGADALNPQAVGKIFIAKGRPSDNPLIVHVAEMEQVRPLVREISPLAQSIMEAYWPGPLTLIFPKSGLVPGEVTAGLDTVAVRMPAHPVARALIKAAGVPVAAPSANISGRPSPTQAEHVRQDLEGRIPLILDGGEADVGVESTVLDLTVSPPMVLRHGGITWEMLSKTIGPVQMDLHEHRQEKPRSPGMKYTHYSPKAEVKIIGNRGASLEQEVCDQLNSLVNEGKKPALLLSEETYEKIRGAVSPYYLELLGTKKDLAEATKRLFAAFRNCDAAGADVILIEEYPEEGLGRALMNRVSRAAGK